MIVALSYAINLSQLFTYMILIVYICSASYFNVISLDLRQIGSFYSQHKFQHGLLNTAIMKCEMKLLSFIHRSITTNPFLNFIGRAVEVWEWMIYFIPRFTGHVITYQSIRLNIFISNQGKLYLYLSGKRV